MRWLIFIAVILTIFTVCFILTWCICRFKYGRKLAKMSQCFGFYGGGQEMYKYIVTPLRGHSFQHEMPKMKSIAVEVQPSSANLDLRLLTMWTKPQPLNNQNVNIGMPFEMDQMPLISNYKSDKESELTWMTNARRSLEESYKQTISPTIDDVYPIIAIQETNVSKKENRVETELSFSIFYDAPSKDLHVTVLRATGLPVEGSCEDVTRRAHYFRVNARVEPWETKWRGTRSVCGATEASFGETFIVSGLVHHKLRECCVHFVVISLEEYKNCWKVVGEVTQSLIECRANQLIKVTKKLSQM